MAENQLGKTDWLAGGDGPSLADIAAYQEVSQCQEKFVDVFDFGLFISTVFKLLDFTPGVTVTLQPVCRGVTLSLSYPFAPG